jgi:cytidine deaminase
MDDIDELASAASACCERAYAPYSNFKVGAAVRSASGRIFVGCNVENASFPVGLCAEAAAIAAMAAAGERRIAAIAIISEADEPIAPCGACRQRIAEFADASTRVILLGARGARTFRRPDELLPHAFRFPSPAEPRHE